MNVPLELAGSGLGLTAVSGTAVGVTYRLFLDVRHGSVVHTAAFTVATGEGSAS